MVQNRAKHHNELSLIFLFEQSPHQFSRNTYLTTTKINSLGIIKILLSLNYSKLPIKISLWKKYFCQTYPRRTFPRRTLPDRHFPDKHFPNQTHARWTLPRPGTSATNASPTRHIPDGHFPDQTHPRRILPRPNTSQTDISLTRHISEGHFPD